ncbi:MAG TPA: hypothetical protein VJQ43_02300 [Thermoplasmata archaeon]|nr:hypothetical protein [Thermoplasmata archaeon]
MALGTFGFVALVVMILPASATLTPMTVTQKITITAPYTGTISSPSSSTYTSGCGTATIVTPAFFHTGTGQAGLSGTAGSRVCPGMMAGYGSAYESIYSEIPLTVLAGTNHIAAHWTVHAAAGNMFHLGKCTMPAGNNTSFSECYATAASSLSVFTYVYDSTNGSFWYPVGNSTWSGLSSSTSYYDYCYAGNCSSSTTGAPGSVSFSGPVVWHFNARGLVTSHSYWLIASFYGSEFSDAGAYGATLTNTHGYAWLNFGTFGNGAVLNSIVIT